MQRAIQFIGFLISASLFLSAQGRMATSTAAAAPTRAASPTPVAIPSQVAAPPTNAPSLIDTVGQPVGSTPTQGTAAQIPSTSATGTTTTTSTTPPPSSVLPGQIQVVGMSEAVAMPTSVAGAAPTVAQVLGTGNFSRSDSAWSLPENRQSLADVAREARQRLARDHPRVFTNDDIARLRHAAGEPGRPGLVTNEQTMPASDIPIAVPRANHPNDSQQKPNGEQIIVPAPDHTPDQTTPPTATDQNQRPSPFRPKK
jgi:hypothetical protein